MNVRVAVALFAMSCGSAHAGFDQWTYEKTSDPFSGGEKVEVDYSTSMRSGIFITCDTAGNGLDVRAIAGWEYDPALKAMKPAGKFAFDGEVLFGAEGVTGAFGPNIAGVQFDLAAKDAAAFSAAMKSARSQIAVQDGISNKPHLLTARGSTKAGDELLKCLSTQRKDEAAAASADEGDTTAVTAGINMAVFLGYLVALEKKCPEYRIRPELTEFKGVDPAILETAALHLAGETVDAQAEIANISCESVAAKIVETSGLSSDELWSMQ
ncbi:hypothetical protein LL06_00875 [Hoeflea sp. BAL378]|nr:hypothetical protein LL06_00875 [Hoeflea sp. BAL378]